MKVVILFQHWLCMSHRRGRGRGEGGVTSKNDTNIAITRGWINA